MNCKLMELGSLVSIKTGAPMSRAKKIEKGDEISSVKVLVPGAMNAGQIDDKQLILEQISRVKNELFTQEGDIILKSSTPYDCVFIDKKNEGLLVTSFGLILRPLHPVKINMCYLAAYLELEQTNKELQALSKGISIQLIKKRDLSGLLIPVPSQEIQEQIAKIFKLIQNQKKLCREISNESDLLLHSEFANLIIRN